MTWLNVVSVPVMLACVILNLRWGHPLLALLCMVFAVLNLWVVVS